MDKSKNANTEKSAVVNKRDERHADKIATKIWYEKPSENNPYLASDSYLHGYDLLQLMRKRSYPDLIFLLFKGSLPSAREAELLNRLMVVLINPGPRHPATRAAMVAGAGKTDPVHIMPIAAAVMGGQHLGAGEVGEAMRFLARNKKYEPDELLVQLGVDDFSGNIEEDSHIAPGFGRRFGGIDQLVEKQVAALSELGEFGPCLGWGTRFAKALEPYQMGWLTTGMAAACLLDLGFHARVGGILYQLFTMPGMLAHGAEMIGKPHTVIPFVADENYVIEE
jgi:citrate synthase